MGLIHIEMFATLDLVGQAPGGPEEDPVGFPFGGWQAPLMDEVSGAQVVTAYEDTDALCSDGGRMTSSPPIGRTRRVVRTTRSPNCSTASRSTSLREAGPTSRGPARRSSVRISLARCERCVIGMSTSRSSGA